VPFHNRGVLGAGIVTLGTVETRWTQPFHWGVLTAGEADRPWDVPALSGNSVTAPFPSRMSRLSFMSVAHRFADAEFTAHLLCDSGRLKVGDAEAEPEVEVPSGAVRIDVARAPVEFAEVVRLRVDRE
jgi:hypothetical protein